MNLQGDEMPIYEYRCTRCGQEFSSLILKSSDEDEMRCKTCGAKDLSRLLSRFAIHRTEAQRLEKFDTRKPQDESFYKDSRNIGLWARKRAKELGADLGDQFEETMEKGRTGKILEDYEL